VRAAEPPASGKKRTRPAPISMSADAGGGPTDPPIEWRGVVVPTRKPRWRGVVVPTRQRWRMDAAAPSGADIESLHAALRKRADEVADGAGRRYRVVTQVGFLNVHSAVDSPWRTDNVVAQLKDGEVVESLREDGAWVNHDGGGWSVREWGGHTFLAPIE